MKKIQKRTGELVPFDASKIVKAIIKAMRHGSGIVDIEVAQLIASKITMSLRDNWWDDMTPTISDIEAMVFHELTLMGGKGSDAGAGAASAGDGAASAAGRPTGRRLRSKPG